MEVKTIEPISCYVKEFNTPDEFNIFYSKNKDTIDPLTTHKLNKMYNIQGYHITRIQGVIMLKKYDPKKHKRYFSNKDENEAIHELREEIYAEIKGIKDTVNELITYIKGSS